MAVSAAESSVSAMLPDGLTARVDRRPLSDGDAYEFQGFGGHAVRSPLEWPCVYCGRTAQDGAIVTTGPGNIPTRCVDVKDCEREQSKNLAQAVAQAGNAIRRGWVGEPYPEDGRPPVPREQGRVYGHPVPSIGSESSVAARAARNAGDVDGVWQRAYDLVGNIAENVARLSDRADGWDKATGLELAALVIDLHKVRLNMERSRPVADVSGSLDRLTASVARLSDRVDVWLLPGTPGYVWDLLAAFTGHHPLDFEGHDVPEDVQAYLDSKRDVLVDGEDSWDVRAEDTAAFIELVDATEQVLQADAGSVTDNEPFNTAMNRLKAAYAGITQGGSADRLSGGEAS